MAVVDPGVATDRRAVAIEVVGGTGVLIGPDNGLLAPAVAMAGGAERAVELTNPAYQLAAPGATFAGRDVFAPAAAHICNGVEIGELGPEVDPVLLMPATVPLPRDDGDAVVAEVLWVDRFGNCQLNVGPEDLPSTWAGDVQLRVLSAADPSVGDVRRMVRASSFAALGSGRAGLVLDSYGMLAVCLDRRSAAEELGLTAGDQVLLAALDDELPSATAVSFGRRRGRPVACRHATRHHAHARPADGSDPDRRHRVARAPLILAGDSPVCMPGSGYHAGRGGNRRAREPGAHDRCPRRRSCGAHRR